MIRNFGACLVSLLPAAESPLWSPTDFHSQDHARLKEHVSSMQGGLEASVHEGGESSMRWGRVLKFLV